jgi:hypothetical protein
LSDLNPEEQAQVVIGGEAEDFLESELGQVVLGMAKQDLEAAIIAFDEADATDQRRVLAIQQDVRVARKFKQYLVELIDRGRETYHASKRED